MTSLGLRNFAADKTKNLLIMNKLKLSQPLRACATMVSLLIGLTAQSQQVEQYDIIPTQPRQHIQHFGASDAWSMRFIGLWPEWQQNQVADWLFSTENDAWGKPKGIGLSIWRFNLGAGSAEQGDSSHINFPTRTECVLRSDGTYDWSRQAGQRQFLKLAKRRGVPYILAFCNSAPVFFTKNGLATNTGRGSTINLKDNCYDDFARYMATAIKGIETHDSVKIDYISPVNEPDGSWNWIGPKQEGSPASNREVAHVARELDKALSKAKLDTEIMLSEASDYRCLLGVHDAGWQRGNEIESYFCPDSTATYVGRLKHLPHLIGAHSYWTNTPVDFMRETRKRVAKACGERGIKFWQTEICIMSNDKEIGGGSGYDHSMKTALYVARVIHHDLVYANAESWSWWRAAGGDYRDGLLRVYSNDNWKTGWAIDSKLLWALGNYSRFVRPGAQRFTMVRQGCDMADADDSCTDPNGVMCSAYRNTNGKWVVVAINYSEEAKTVNFTVKGSTPIEWSLYRTSDTSAESLAPVGNSKKETLLAPRSITTFVEP